MDNPLESPVPDDPIERIHVFARVLAYGAVRDYWTSRISINHGFFQWSESQMSLLSRWQDKEPSPYLLVSFGYLNADGPPSTPKVFVPIDEAVLGSTARGFFLTPKAFSLLNKPIVPPSVFVSYKRDESSALGLLIEARLKLADSNIDVFIDKLLEPGDKWHAQLEEKVRQSRYFICLLGPKSLGSRYVRNEIYWALDEAEKSGNTIIPVCHNGYSIGSDLPKELEEYEQEIRVLIEKVGVNNAIPIYPESAEEYELAIMKLLNKLGYSNI